MNIFRRLVVILLLFVSFSLMLSACGTLSPDVYMFKDLEECRTMAADESIQAHLTIYETPEKDKHVKGLEYVDFFACYYESDDLEFELFAYQFKETDASKEYFASVVGRQCTYDTDFLKSAGMFSYKGIVISGNMAYTVYTKRSGIGRLNELLGFWFTQELVYYNGQGQLQPKGE